MIENFLHKFEPIKKIGALGQKNFNSGYHLSTTLTFNLFKFFFSIKIIKKSFTIIKAFLKIDTVTK